LALSDPQSVTINAVANSLPRVGFGAGAGAFQKDDSTVALSVAHSTVQKGKRNRHQVRLDVNKIAADPLISAQNIKYSASAYLVVDVPITGYTVTEQKQFVDGLTKWLTDSSGANLLKVLGFES
jgi:hypothetical protein